MQASAPAASKLRRSLGHGRAECRTAGAATPAGGREEEDRATEESPNQVVSSRRRSTGRRGGMVMVGNEGGGLEVDALTDGRGHEATVF